MFKYRKWVAAVAAFGLWLSVAPAVADDSYTPSHPLGIVAYAEDNTLAGADSTGTVNLSMPYDSTTGDNRTAVVAPLAVGPLNLQAGDVIHVDAQEQFKNDNSTVAPNAWWGVTNYYGQWVQSEHWTLWVMGACSIRYGTSVNPNGGAWIAYQQEENFENWRHYMDCDQSKDFHVKTAMTGAYIYTRVYFVASHSQVNPSTTPTMKIVYSGTGKAYLTATVYR